MFNLDTIKAASFTFSTRANAESFNNRLAKPLWMVEIAGQFWLVRPKHAAWMASEGLAEYA